MACFSISLQEKSFALQKRFITFTRKDICFSSSLVPIGAFLNPDPGETIKADLDEDPKHCLHNSNFLFAITE